MIETPNWFRLQRAKLGLSAMDVAMQLGVHLNTLMAWETGRATPRAERWADIASLFGVPLEEVGRQTYAGRIRPDRRAS
jgi:DNA-binding XRE family transcriptional regulator